VYLVAVLSLIAISAPAPRAARTWNRLATNKLASNRLASNKLASNKLASNALTSTSLDANMATADLLSTSDGRVGIYTDCHNTPSDGHWQSKPYREVITTYVTCSPDC
jgi:hypothetical protein